MTLEEMITKEVAEWEQLTRANNSQMIQEKTPLDIEARRNTIIGEIAINHFPQWKHLDPQETEYDNQDKFAPVEAFFSLLSDDTNYVNNLFAAIDEAFS